MINLLLGCTFTLVLFALMRRVNQSWHSPLFNPVLLCILIISTTLLSGDIDYIDYRNATKPVSFFLEVAVVALALPLYQQLHTIRPYLLLISLSSFIGITCATLIAFCLCQLFSAPGTLTASLMALSVTTPITLIVTDSLSGFPGIAAIMVILIGVLGGVFGLSLFTLAGVTKPQAKGIALGVACHAIGTAAAMEHHPAAGAFASAAMIISAVITASWVPMLFTLLQGIIS
ncbi:MULTISPECIES: LrgB family protein [unclassified Pseudoalteromonas]|uniref:LrgB family protein n=1 Tax=unclassified Pseudoalteromonas TaxID=194690 RepID=UPI0020970A17|nr:LrgB family protein [Pseudoalteromonas sp. XMcav2-N]MCO7187037.1 LrgB family protein [Pseudoalteromonas sp. XMcav2-N]